MTPSGRQQRSIVDVLDESAAWQALFVLWIALAVAWVMMVRAPDSTWPATLVVAWLGLTAAGAITERARWWWIGLVSIAMGLAGAAVVGWMMQAAYPTSDLAWVPFTSGASLRWQYFGAVLVLGLSVSVAVRSRVQGSGLARAALVSLAAIFYLFRGPFPFTPDEVPIGLIALTLTLVAIGAADHVATRIAANRMLHNAAAVVVSLAALFMAAGIVWSLILIPPTGFDIFFPREVNNVLPTATMTAVVALAVTIGIRAAARDRRFLRVGHLIGASFDPQALWLHVRQKAIFWVLFGALLGVEAGRTATRITSRVLKRQRPDCSLPGVGGFDCEEGLGLVERLDWLFILTGAAVGIGIALAIWAMLDHHPTEGDPIPTDKAQQSSDRRPQA